VELLASTDDDDKVPQAVISEVLSEIDYYPDKAGGPDPWSYARCHRGTAANLYSNLHWSYFEPSGFKTCDSPATDLPGLAAAMLVGKEGFATQSTLRPSELLDNHRA
jgi:hypothetical protein